MKILTILFASLIAFNFSYAQSVDIQGHRGARGLLPENSINGFIKAVDLGVTTLELDVVISKDKYVLVSHEPYLSSNICAGSSGALLPDNSHNIYEMNYEEIKQYDCGINGNPQFIEQEKVSTYKPLLSEVFEIIDKHISENNLPKVNYNIEIKSNSKGDRINHPIPSDFADLVYAVVEKNIDKNRVTIQSFDPRPLKYLHLKDPELNLAFLVENKINYKKQLKKLGFKPNVYSPYYRLLDENMVSDIQNRGIKVIPWTVNEIPEMELLISWGVDGIITDYPNRAVPLIKK